MLFPPHAYSSIFVCLCLSLAAGWHGRLTGCQRYLHGSQRTGKGNLCIFEHSQSLEILTHKHIIEETSVHVAFSVVHWHLLCSPKAYWYALYTKRHELQGCREEQVSFVQNSPCSPMASGDSGPWRHSRSARNAGGHDLCGTRGLYAVLCDVWTPGCSIVSWWGAPYNYTRFFCEERWSAHKHPWFFSYCGSGVPTEGSSWTRPCKLQRPCKYT